MIVNRLGDGHVPFDQSKSFELTTPQPFAPFLEPIFHNLRRLDGVMHHCHNVRLTSATFAHQNNRTPGLLRADCLEGSLDVGGWIGN